MCDKAIHRAQSAVECEDDGAMSVVEAVASQTGSMPFAPIGDVRRQIDTEAAFPYMVKVNRALNRVVIYGLDHDGAYSIPYKGFVCSTGREGHETPLGTFTTSDYYEWGYMVDGSYARYAIRFYKSYLLHSVPYFSASKDNLETAEYNKLGSCASRGCVRLAVADIKWIYDNCPKGTPVTIYDNEDEIMPVQFADPVRVPTGSSRSGWDPTDPDERNPWRD